MAYKRDKVYLMGTPLKCENNKDIQLLNDLRNWKSLSPVWFFATPWTVARQAPLSMGFSRQEYWNGLLFPPAGDFPNPGLNPTSPALAGRFSTAELPGKPQELETYN